MDHMYEDYDHVRDTRSESKKYNGKSMSRSGWHYYRRKPEFTVDANRETDDLGHVSVSHIDYHMAKRDEGWKLLEGSENAGIDIADFVTNIKTSYRSSDNDKKITLEVPISDWVKPIYRDVDKKLEKHLSLLIGKGQKPNTRYFENSYYSSDKLYARYGGHLKEFKYGEKLDVDMLSSENVKVHSTQKRPEITELKTSKIRIASSMLKPIVSASSNGVDWDYIMVDEYGNPHRGYGEKYIKWAQKQIREDYNKESKNGIIIDFPEASYLTHIKFSIQSMHVTAHCVDGAKTYKDAIKVLEHPNNIPYLSMCGIYYYNGLSKTWVHLQNYTANSLVMLETLIDLSIHFNNEQGLYTKRIKIVPLNYHLYPCFNINIYGRTSDSIEQIKTQADTLATEPGTIKYTLNLENQVGTKRIKAGVKYRYPNYVGVFDPESNNKKYFGIVCGKLEKKYNNKKDTDEYYDYWSESESE